MTAHTSPNTVTTPVRALWSLREDTHVETEPDATVLHTRWDDVRISGAEPAAHELLRRMALGPVSLENLAQGEDSGLRRARLMLLLDRIRSVVVRSLALQDADQPLLSAIPIAPAAGFRPVRLSGDQPLRLSRFASLAPGADGMVLESALSLYRLVFSRPEALWVVSALGRRTTPDAVAAVVPLPPQVVREVLLLLVGTGMAVLGESEDGHARFSEDEDRALTGWTGRELLQHTRSRLGRHDDDFGTTYRFVDRFGPEPALKPLPQGTRVPLERPGPEAPADPPLSQVLAGRRSVRRHGERPIDLAQLGHFLDRVARIRSLSAEQGADGDPTYYQTTRRPYPTGGAAYELEFYLTVSRCAGLSAGVYYYDPSGHQLVLVREADRDTEELLLGAQLASGTDQPPQVLITLTSRFQRLSWKYSAMWYSLTLKHVGVVLQTMYLVATALGLAPCALGAGDVEAGARAFGLDWLRESSVGEFMLGSLPDDADMTRLQGCSNDASTR